MHELLALSTLLLADGAGVAQTVGVGVGTGAVGVAVTLAVLKWRADKTEEKDKEQDKEHKETAKALTELTAAVRVQATEVKNEIHESEARTDQKLKDLTRTISRKIEGLKEIQAEHGTRLAVVENDQKHMGDRVESHARKLTLYGKVKAGSDD